MEGETKEFFDEVDEPVTKPVNVFDEPPEVK